MAAIKYLIRAKHIHCTTDIVEKQGVFIYFYNKQAAPGVYQGSLRNYYLILLFHRSLFDDLKAVL